MRNELLKHKEVREKLILGKKRFNLIMEGSKDVIWEWNMRGGKFFVSEKWKELTGFDLPDNYSLFEVLAKIVHPEDMVRVNSALQSHIEGVTEFFECEYRIKTKVGVYKWILQKGKALKDEGHKHTLMAGSISDITYKKIYEEEINYLAYHDVVTNLPNRIYFEKKLNEELNKLDLNDFKMAFFFIDLDDFKKINDIYGHEIGDKFLLNIAKELQSTLEEKQILCRFGGDEFLLAAFEYGSINKVISKAEELIKISSKELKIGDKKFYPSLSIGGSLYDEKWGNIDDMLKYSDIAMYEAKRSGKNRYVIFDDRLFKGFIKERKLETDLDKALNNNEFILYYQPLIDVANKKVYGIEALLRWNHPELGLLTPASFIDILEKSERINEVGKFVIFEVCCTLRKLKALGYDDFLASINVCEKQLADSYFVDYVQEVFEMLDVNPKSVCFEITERTLLNKNKTTFETLEILRSIGIEILIDDFGIGYSSLSYLNIFDVSGIKLDKSFIDKISCSKKDYIITKNIVNLTHDLNIQVIAEGVESEEQVTCLKDINCFNVQGFLFSKPVCLDEVINYINEFNYKCKQEKKIMKA